MATRTQEIDTIGDLLATVGVSRFYKENFPSTYVANTIGIRWQGDSSDGLTNVLYTIENTYQLVYFGSSRVDCLNKSEAISGLINDKIDMKTKIRDLLQLPAISFLSAGMQLAWRGLHKLPQPKRHQLLLGTLES